MSRPGPHSEPMLAYYERADEFVQAAVAAEESAAILIGLRAAGKHWVGERLQEHGYVLIDLDELIRTHIMPKHPEKSEATVFDLYWSDGDFFQGQGELVRRVEHAACAAAPDARLVLVGAINTPCLIGSLAEAVRRPTLVGYVQPTGFEPYRAAVERRLRTDLARGARTPRRLWSLAEGPPGPLDLSPPFTAEVRARITRAAATRFGHLTGHRRRMLEWLQLVAPCLRLCIVNNDCEA